MLQRAFQYVSSSVRARFPRISMLHIKRDRAKIKRRQAAAGSSKGDGLAEEGAQDPVDIVADRDCIITDMITRKGVPMVKEGSQVKEGDILVSGQVPVPPLQRTASASCSRTGKREGQRGSL